MYRELMNPDHAVSTSVAVAYHLRVFLKIVLSSPYSKCSRIRISLVPLKIYQYSSVPITCGRRYLP